MVLCQSRWEAVALELSPNGEDLFAVLALKMHPIGACHVALEPTRHGLSRTSAWPVRLPARLPARFGLVGPVKYKPSSFFATWGPAAPLVTLHSEPAWLSGANSTSG